MKINYFDIHSHLESSKFDQDREEIISRMKDEGVFTITVGTDLENSKKAVRLADKYENIFASIGLHPTDVKEDFKEEDYLELVKNKKVVAIGECGLEFFRLGEDAEDEKQRQIDIFKKQIDFAVKYDKPLMIHCRDAHTEVINILTEKKKEYGERLRGNIHFFSGDVDMAQVYLDLGFMMSFTGVITFTKDYDEVIKFIPLDKIMSETDAPFVAPVPYRGKRCEPTYVKETVKRIAEIKELDEEVVKKAMIENAQEFFKIKNLKI
ncbi:TatD family hydrolase [Patescibacteria group bacterium]|nr:TatD family hydrolase [Patescibacteria group bacterium]MCG2695019.1 TatD family hydrolase [Candidatus Parcubacteria bacterium]